MKRVELAYGRRGLSVEVGADADVIEPRYVAGLADEAAAIRAALRAPTARPAAARSVPRGASVGISVCDVTRPFPGRRVLPVLIEELQTRGAGPITHLHRHRHAPRRARRPSSSRCSAQTCCGAAQSSSTTPSTPAATARSARCSAPRRRRWSSRHSSTRTCASRPASSSRTFSPASRADPKMVAPGLAAIETVLDLHSAARIGHPCATWGITEGNPVHDAVRAIAAQVGVTFNLDVTLNRDHAITNVFSGELFASHAAGCAFARADRHGRRGRRVRRRADHQQRLSARPEPVSERQRHERGRPDRQTRRQHRHRQRVLGRPARRTAATRTCCARPSARTRSWRSLLEPGFSVHDQWQVQVQAQIQRKARVFVKADGLSAEPGPRRLVRADRRRRRVRPRAARPRPAPGARLAVLPQGPQTIPYVVD